MTDKRPWTAEQRRAIETLGCSLLVSAAAGSGKTSVLAERCCYLVCDAPQRVAVGQLLVVTFTEAAAAEMKHRIQAALRARLATTEDEYLRRQLALVEHANISTVHGFCHRLLRQHFHRLGLDPQFRVLDGDEAVLLRNEVARDLFVDRYEGDASGDFGRFVDAYGDGNDEPLLSQVIAMHEMLCSLVDPRGWMDRARRQIEDGASRPLEESELGRQYLRSIDERLAALEADCAAAVAAVARMEGFAKYVQYLRELAGVLAHWRKSLAKGYDRLVEAVGLFETRIPNVSKSVPGRDVANAFVTGIVEAMRKGALARSLRFTGDQWRTGLESIRPHAAVLLGLVEEFGSRYRAAKDRMRGLDFSDLERFALRLLREESGAPSAVARAYQRQFAHVLVDEYQDINEVQDAILSLVSRESNSFCVGDVKQSIYRFRLAEPSRFLGREQRFRDDGAPGRVIDLQANFRSRKPLLDGLNQMFARLMTRSAVDIEYDQSQWLHAKLKYPPGAGEPWGQTCFAGAPIELHLLPQKIGAAEDDSQDEDDATGELGRAEIEALLVARRINELLGKGAQPRRCVMERGAGGAMSPRPIEPRDIVVLLRSTKYQAEAYAAILRKHGIPTFNATGAGYFESTEVRDIVALLRLLDNQQQDVPMAAVLRGPLAGLAEADDAMGRIRIAYPRAEDRNAAGVPFHQAVVRYAAEKSDELAIALRAFLAQVATWRQLAQRQPVADVIWRIYQDTGYLAFCNGLENGQQRCANLLYLHQRAQQFGEFSRQGLSRFIGFLQSLEQQAPTAQASELGQADNVVRIMSVHSAKGLEFPVVILPDLGKKINAQGWSGNILADRQALLGLVSVDEHKQVRYPSLASTIVSERLKQQGLAEELRVLYVATTRAREHLIMIGSARSEAAETWGRRWSGHRGSLPREAVLDAKCMLDWVGPATAAIGGARMFAVQVHSEAEVAAWAGEAAPKEERDEIRAALIALRPLKPEPEMHPVAREVIENLTRVYPHEAFATLGASVSVTGWTKHARPEPAGVLESSRPVSTPASADSTQTGMSAPPGGGRCAPETGGAPVPQPGRLEVRLDQPRFLQAADTLAATERGTAVHLVLEHLDFRRPCDRADLEAQIARLLEKRLVAPAQAKVVDYSAIEWFLDTEIGRLARAEARNLLRELPINYPLAPERFGLPPSADPMDRVMLRGRLDLVIPTAQGWHVLDYKTDRVDGAMLDERVALYTGQVEIYREVIERIMGVKVIGVHLVFLHPRQVVSV